MSDCYGQNLNASLVQLVERRSPKPDVEGSSPSRRVSSILFMCPATGDRTQRYTKAGTLLGILLIAKQYF